MTVNHTPGKKSGLFYIKDNDRKIAAMFYIVSTPHEIVITHTEVNEAFAGQGLGNKLVKAAVEYARLNHIKITPECSFARSVFDETPAYADVLHT